MSIRDEYVDQLKSTFITVGKQAIMKFMVAKFPFLGFSFVNPIAAYFVQMVLLGIVTEAETAAFFLYIDMRTGEQAKDFEAAARENYIAQRSGTPLEQKNAEEKLRLAFKKFAMLTN